MPIKVFFHICAITRCYEVVDEMIQCILNSGLYIKAEGIYCYISGEDELGRHIINLLASSGAKFKVVKFAPGDTSYERLTLEHMHNIVRRNDKVLYIHSKGVSKHHIPNHHRLACIDDWRKMMMYFLVGKHDTCISLLDTYQTVGVNERKDHWNGNFWWVRGDYFLTLPRKIGPEYFDPECNFLFNNNPSHKSLYNSPVQHYEVRWPYQMYIDQ